MDMTWVEKGKNPPSKITIYGRNVGPKTLYIHFSAIVVVFSCSAMAFWYEFLLAESNECDPRMDCFAFPQEDGSSNNPLENCTDYENDNYTIQCFKFVFNYADGLGNSGGVLILSKVIVSIHISMWIAIASLCPAKSQTCTCSCFCIIGTLYIIISFISIVIIWLVIFNVSLLSDQLLGSHKSLTLFAYTVVFYITLIVSGPLFIFSTTKDCDGHGNVNSHYQSIENDEGTEHQF